VSSKKLNILFILIVVIFCISYSYYVSKKESPPTTDLSKVHSYVENYFGSCFTITEWVEDTIYINRVMVTAGAHVTHNILTEVGIKIYKIKDNGTEEALISYEERRR